MAKVLRKAAGFVVYRINTDEVIEYLLMQASYENYHWTPPKGMNSIPNDYLHLISLDYILYITHLR